MNTDNDLLEKIQRAKQEYYSENQKNLFFKNKQKLDCASQIVQQIDPNLVFAQIIYLEKNQIIFNYPLFKLVATPSIYMDLANRAFFVTAEILRSYPNYDIYINLQGITISAVERYKDFISLVSSEGLKNGNNFLKSLNKVYLQNPPSFLESGYKMIQPILDPVITERIVIIPK
jgi:hypothetical protein